MKRDAKGHESRHSGVHASLAAARRRALPRALALLLAGAAAAGAVGCGPVTRSSPPVAPSLGDWTAALHDLAALRAKAAGDGPHTLKLALALREPFTGRRTEARGAVALSAARRAVRMILVGPGGTTAFDLWIAADAFRVAIPAIDLLKRGDASTPKEQMRGLPVDFLRWWLLDPTRGELLWAERTPERARYVLREGGAITTLDVRSTGALSAPPTRPALRAVRQTWSRGDAAGGGPPRTLLDEEVVEADSVGCGHARYTQSSTGVEIEITCEGVEPNPPNPRAFDDPDAPSSDDEEGS